jgi:hypothetical protein
MSPREFRHRQRLQDDARIFGAVGPEEDDEPLCYVPRPTLRWVAVEVSILAVLFALAVIWKW